MRTMLLGAAAVAALCFAGAGVAQSPVSLADDAAAFGAREAVHQPNLSPDGSKVLYLTPASGRKTAAVIMDLGSGQFTNLLSSDGEPESLDWCGFAAPGRVICNFSGHTEAKGLGDLLGFSRLISMGTDGGNPKLLGQAESAYDAWLRQDDGSIVDWLDVNGSVLMERLYVPEEGKIGSLVINKKKGSGVDRVDVTTLKSHTVESPKDAAGYMSDGRGNVRLLSLTDSHYASGQMTGTIRYSYRSNDSKEWKPLATVTDALNPDFVPLAIDSTINSLYALKKREGRYALHTIRLDGSMAETLTAENRRVDIDDVIRFGKGQRVIGYTFAEEERKAVYFDPEFKSLAASLSKALPNLPMISFVDASRDGSKVLVFASSDSDPGRYYLFDKKAKSLNEAMLARPQLQGRKLASVKSVTVSAADGTQIPAYLTVPAGMEAKNLPAVVLPHGGPSARDEWGFDWLAQFLAARGYVVVQPNYRGSAGFGDAWLNKNGFRNWRTSIGDISSSARWVAAQGIADPNRIAIVGASYGGYAALQSAAVDPSLYKAVAAIAPVTDLAQLKQDSRNFSNHWLVSELIGTGPHVAEGSPLRNAAAISAPVLLLHGTMDSNVRYHHSQRMHSALLGAGKQSELVTFKGIDHSFDDSSARIEMLTRLGSLLERTIGR